MIAHARLWVDRKGRLTESPPPSGFLVAAGPGDEIEAVMIDRYSLIERGGKVTQKQAEQKQAATPENKQAKAPPNKSGGVTFTDRHGTRTSKRK